MCRKMAFMKISGIVAAFHNFALVLDFKIELSIAILLRLRSSVRSEIFVATRATPFPSPVGAAYSGACARPPDGA